MPFDAVPITLEETFRALCDVGHRRFGKIPAELIAAQILALTEGADWPVRRAAMEALLRRHRFAQRDELRVVSAPRRGAVFGVYGTARKAEKRRRGARPYATLLSSLVPLQGSCDCADFLTSSLGVCKHLLAVLDGVCRSAPQVARAEREQAARGAEGDADPILAWLPALALHGALDRATGLRLSGRGGGRPPSGWVSVEAPPARARRTSPRSREGDAVPPQLPGDAAAAWALVRAPDAIVVASTAVQFMPDPAVLAELDRRASFLAGAAKLRDVNVEPAARALIADELARAERRIEARDAARDALSQLRTLGRKLYPYQREGVERFVSSGRLLLADDMGLGKTTQAIAGCHALFRSGRVKRGVLIVPAALKPQWLREWQETTEVPAALVDGSPTERERLYRTHKEGFLILGYEQLLRDLHHVHRMSPELVVLDEAQRIKNWATKSATYVKALTPRYRLVLTGTPMENRLEELASVLDWVDDVALAPKWRLDAWHTTSDGDGGRGMTGARNLDALRARMQPCVLRRLRRDVLTQLPSRTDTRVPVPMTDAQREEHDQHIIPIKAIVATARRRPLTQAEFLKLMQLLTLQRIASNGMGQLHFEELWPAYSGARPDAALLEGLFAPKLGELRRLVQELVVDQERKVVIFSQWRRMLRLAEWALRDVLGDVGVRAVFFTGAESTAQRTRSIVDFHDEPGVRVMLLSDAGGVGLNLQRAASACINLELPWNPAVLEQRIGRIYRLGQKRPIDVFNLVTEYGIEARIAELIATKKALFTGLFDGTTDELRFAGKSSFLSDVEKLVVAVPDLSPPTPKELAEAEAEAGEADPDLPEPDAADEAEASGAIELATPLAARSAAAPLVAPAPPPPAAVADLLGSLRIAHTPGGGISIEAPPESAAALVALFQGMASLIGASGGSGRRTVE